jgi:hypothetical protein
MDRTRHITARSASRAAWPMSLGLGGVAGNRVTGTGPAPI